MAERPTFVVIAGDVFFADAEVRKLQSPLAGQNIPGTFMLFTGLCDDGLVNIKSRHLANLASVYSTAYSATRLGDGYNGVISVPGLGSPGGVCVYGNLMPSYVQRINNKAHIIEAASVEALATELGKVISGGLVVAAAESALPDGEPLIKVAGSRTNLGKLTRPMKSPSRPGNGGGRNEGSGTGKL